MDITQVRDKNVSPDPVYNTIFACDDLTKFFESIVVKLPFSGFSDSKFYICARDKDKHTAEEEARAKALRAKIKAARLVARPVYEQNIHARTSARAEPPRPSSGIAISGTDLTADKQLRTDNYFLTKVYFFYKSPEEVYGAPGSNRGTLSHADTEIAILTELDKLVQAGVTPCILRLDYHKICSPVAASARCRRDHPFASPASDAGLRLCDYLDRVHADLAYDKFAFLVLEMCDITLDNYIRNVVDTPLSVAIFKSILFMTVYTIYAISLHYPGFHHFDLHVDNVMLKIDREFKYNAKDPRYIIVEVRGAKYYVPYFGIMPKIIDFGFATLPSAKPVPLISNAINDRGIMFRRADNDLLILFHNINHIIESKKWRFIKRIQGLLIALEPNQSYVHYNTTSIRKHADLIPTYEQMVTNEVWDDYKLGAAAATRISGKVIATYRDGASESTI